MPDPTRRIYWDSCVFLSYLEEEAGRIEILETLRHQSARGEIEIVTSVATIVEVAFVATERAGGKLSAEAETAIDGLWSDRIVRLIEFHELIAREARRLIRIGLAQGWSLKGFDAIHLATAHRARLAECHTYDGAWVKYREHTSIPTICEPHVPGGVEMKLF